MKCHIMFSGKNSKNITNISPVNLAQRVVKVDYFMLLRYGVFVMFQTHVRGHQGIAGNEAADRLAVQGAQKQ